MRYERERGPSVALVEDSVDNADLFKTMLVGACGTAQASVFRDGPAFLAALKPGLFDVVVLDISLPGMDGFEVLKRMRAIDAATPVVAFTAHAGRHARETAIKAGFAEYLTKPIMDVEAFCRTILKFAQRSPDSADSAP